MHSPITIKTLANVLGIVLLIAVVAPFVVYAVPAVVGAEHSFVVLTASMTPAIAPGDVVIVDERDPNAIAEGDVITFVRGDNEVPVTHRVIGVTATAGETAFETQGDANEGPDASLVPAENVLGVVAITIPYLGYVIQFADSPIGFALLVVVPFGLLVISEIWSFVQNRNRGSPQTDPVAVAGTVEEDTATETDPEPAGITVDAVVGAGAVLAVFAPYSAYVALQLQTALAVSMTIAAVVLLLGAVTVWVSETGRLDRSGARTATEDSNGSDAPGDTGNAVVRAESAAPPDEPAVVADGSGEVD